MDSELVPGSLVYRYDPTASPDGLRGHMAALVIPGSQPAASSGHSAMIT